jgi:uncharacterized iron-regulated membrane protein
VLRDNNAVASEPSLWQRWLRRPQNVWLRRALFQVHLWTGIGLGLYVVLISMTGSAIVFRNEVYKAASEKPKTVAVSGNRMSQADLKEQAKRVYPQYNIEFVWEGKTPTQPTEIWLIHDGTKKQRLFDPYTGADLGDSIPPAIQLFAWFGDLHTNLLFGKTGRVVNGVASILITLLCVTGAIIWWPGAKNWKRSLIFNPKAGWKRLNWDLHSAVGFWSFALIFMWAATGVFLVFPLPFQKAVNHFSPLIQYQLPDSDSAQLAPQITFAQPDGSQAGGYKGKGGKGRRQPPQIRRSSGDIFLRWLYYLHFGNFAGVRTKIAWVVLGLLPPFLFVTGALMWWNRVLSPSARRVRRA